jgi:hypothetical protein
MRMATVVGGESLSVCGNAKPSRPKMSVHRQYGPSTAPDSASNSMKDCPEREEKLALGTDNLALPL